jgi:hypothetical protein
MCLLCFQKGKRDKHSVADNTNKQPFMRCSGNRTLTHTHSLCEWPQQNVLYVYPIIAARANRTRRYEEWLLSLTAAGIYSVSSSLHDRPSAFSSSI